MWLTRLFHRYFVAREEARVHLEALLAMVKSCLDLDPLARPQSVFAVQKALQALRSAPAPALAPAEEEAPASGWRSLFGRLRRQN